VVDRPAASRGKRYEALDSLRGIAACGVVLFHLHSTGLITNAALVRRSWLFVDFFFVLSGFVIAAAYGEKLRRGFPLRAYLLLRVGRLYPLHLFMLAALVAFELAMLAFDVRGNTGRGPFDASRSLPFLAAQIGLVQIFVPGASLSWNGPAWSIAAELWTYLIAALGLVLLKERFRLLLVALVLVAPLLFLGLGREDLGGGGWLALVRCLFGFSLGMLAFDLHQRWRAPGGTAVELVALGLCAAAIALLPAWPWLFFSPFLFAGVILVFAREAGAASALLRTRPFRALGTWSYSIYMVHSFVLLLFLNGLDYGSRWLGAPLIAERPIEGGLVQVIGGSGPLPDLLVIAALASVVLAASLTYRWIELPFREASRRRAERIAHRPLAGAERVAPTM